MIAIPVEPPITEYLHAKAARQGIPLSGTFELTPLCNMNCRMCYVRMSREQQEAIRPLRTAAQWLELGRQAKEQGLLYLLLTGGEPFLRPDFREILAGLHQMGLLISINSNGTLIDESVVRWLKETPPVRINITLYGASLLKAPLHYFVSLAQNTYMPNCQDSSSQKLLVFETAWLAPTML